MSENNSQKQTPTNSPNQSQSEQFEPTNKKQSKKSKQKPVKQSKSKGKKQAPEQKEQKPKKKAPKKKEQKQQKKQAPKRKPKSKKQGGKESSENKSKVLDYMQKQNRPYNMLNIFDNLHGKIKKAELQIILNQLSEQKQLACKQFGKNKVYFLNQDKFDLNMKQVDQLSSTYTHLKQRHKELRDQNKTLNDEYRKLTSKKTFDQLKKQRENLKKQIQKLQKKKDYLFGEDIQKVDEQQVIKIQKQSLFLDKQLKKRKKLTKQCLDMWSEMTQKKVEQIAEIMGIQLV